MNVQENSPVDLERLLQLAVDERASDLHLSVGVPPMLRVDGLLSPVELPPLMEADTEWCMHALANAQHVQEIEQKGGADFCISYGEQARFRTSIFRQRGRISLVLRLIPSELMSLESMGLPHQVQGMLNAHRGLILVTGPTGSGKTTTLASMLDIINQARNGHIITIENPIEYYHEPKTCLVSQRELHSDVPTFSEAIRRGLRQDPDVIMIGEMRDLETMEAAVTAAETGHLVLSTLHTTGATESIDRIIDAFPTQQQEQVRLQIAGCMVGVISQQLIPRVDISGRALACEFMAATPSIRNLIREKKTFRIRSDIQTGARMGMITMDDSLYNLYERRIISYEDALARAQDREAQAERLDSINKKK
ncbi:MAG: type IV pilus twitching motility protein PilT [Kiritimatiellae bacterium]|nr:type IV pilus twitching motility protein PilT [Kiritimatiellia bacterium]